MMEAQFEFKKSENGKPMFNLKAANNQVILTSGLYGDKTAAQNGIDPVKKHS